MKFWDSSALVTLLVEEVQSRTCRDLLRADPKVAAWQFTKTEIASALCRLTRHAERPLSQERLQVALQRLEVLSRGWLVIGAHGAPAVERMHQRALAIMLKHPVLSGDALQLAAAMTYFEPVHRAGFVVVDRGLAHAAKAEGFTVYPERASRRSRARPGRA